MNYKSIVLSAIFAAGLIPSCAFSMERQSVKAEWLSKAKLSEMAQKVTSSEAYNWAAEHKFALLLGTSALITAGIAAYKYLWKQPTNEQIKENIRKNTRETIIAHARNARLGVKVTAAGLAQRSSPPARTDYAITIKSLINKENQNQTCLKANYWFGCDNSTELTEILFEN